MQFEAPPLFLDREGTIILKQRESVFREFEAPPFLWPFYAVEVPYAILSPLFMQFLLCSLKPYNIIIDM